MKPNLTLLKQTAKEMREHLDQVIMNRWYSRQLDSLGVDPLNQSWAGGCGTAGCIAGWINYVDSRNKGKAKTMEDARSIACAPDGRAMSAARITHQQAGRLFHTNGWSKAAKSKLAKAKTQEDYAKVVVGQLENFIKREQRRRAK